MVTLMCRIPYSDDKQLNKKKGAGTGWGGGGGGGVGGCDFHTSGKNHLYIQLAKFGSP